MTKSKYARAVDDIQAAIRPFLMESGFRVRGRSFNRSTKDQLIQVVNIQMGLYDTPGTNFIPGVRENLYGLFTINLGVYVPEVARFYGGGEAKSWIQEYHCCVRSRLGEACGEEKDIWWPARSDDDVIVDVQQRLELGGIPFLERYSTRDKILSEWRDRSEKLGASSPPRIVMAIILVERGEIGRARELLARQMLEAKNSKHAEYVRELAKELELGSLDV